MWVGLAGQNSDLVSVVSATVGNIPAFRNAEEKKEINTSTLTTNHATEVAILSSACLHGSLTRASESGAREARKNDRCRY